MRKSTLQPRDRKRATGMTESGAGSGRSFGDPHREFLRGLSEEQLYDDETQENRLGLTDPLARQESSEDRLFSRIVWTSIAAIAILLSAYLGSVIGSLIY